MGSSLRSPQEGRQVTAAEKAMQDIQTLLEQYYACNIFGPDVIGGVSRIVGVYDMDRIREVPNGNR